MKERPIDKAWKAKDLYQAKYKSLPTYAELERLTEISQTSLASLAVKHKVTLCRKLTIKKSLLCVLTLVYQMPRKDLSTPQ